MHDRSTVDAPLKLAAEGHSAGDIAPVVGVPRRTVADWLNGRVPARAGSCAKCGGVHDLDALPDAYTHLLGLYLGDGYISRHRRGVLHLRLSLDAAYPRLIEEAAASMRAVRPGRPVGTIYRARNTVEVHAYSKTWACLFPQHGPGKKHHRSIYLAAWQSAMVRRRPKLFVRGLIQSDGCRFINTGRNWRHPRYRFDNYSSDIRNLFIWGCDLLGLRWTTSGRCVYVSRKADVARLDEFVGPKR